MNLIKRPASAILLLLITLTASVPAQQKRQAPPKSPPRPAATVSTPAPTFETLLPADSYAIYGEIRGAGQLIRSTTVNDLLEPILKLAGPPKEFKSIVKWLNAHAEQLTSSRLLVATAPTNKTVPETIVAVEFASAEEAAKFVTPLNEFLPAVLPTPEPSPTPKTDANKAAPPEATGPPAPTFHLQRLGALVVITQKPWTMKQLKPAGSKLLAEDANFRTIRNRFNSEPVFLFIDIKALEKQDEEQMKRAEEERQRAEEQAKRDQAAAAAAAVTPEQKKSEEDAEPGDEEKAAEANAKVTPVLVGSDPAKEEPTPDPVLNSLSELGSSLFSGTTDWPDAIGVALSFEGESFDLRALFLSAPGEKSGIVPFMPKLIPGPPLAPESASVFPAADTDLLITMSLDLPQIYAALANPAPEPGLFKGPGAIVPVNKTAYESPFASIEKRLKININNDLIPLLGSEVAVRLPMTGVSMVGGFPAMITGVESQSVSSAPAVAIAIRDKEALRTLMPKLIDSLGFKGASTFAQTERREDTELISYANLFSYAFIGNFIVLSSDAGVTRKIVDSYLKHETLAGDMHFKNYTRWQPRQLTGQAYLSPSLMESFKAWADQPGTRITDQTRAFLARLSMTAQPITYALSNEGFGPLHELHIPKNLVMMAVVGISGEFNPSPIVQNERMAIGLMYTIAWAEDEYKTAKGNGSYSTLDQLMEGGLVPKDGIEKSGYKFDVTISGDKFEITAVPSDYGKSGTLSLFMDQTRVLRGGDRSGASATASDPAIH